MIRSSPPFSTHYFIVDSSTNLTPLPWNGLVLHFIYRAGEGANPRFQMEELQEACVKSTAGMYICEVCDSDFIQKCHLTRHMHNHTEQTFVCQLCFKPFSRRDKLNCHIGRKHQTIMNKEQTYPCPECRKLFHLNSIWRGINSCIKKRKDKLC